MPRPALALVAVALFLAMAGFGIIVPALPFYTAQLQGDDATVAFTVGMLMATYSLVQFACAPLWGHLSDRYGRRPVFLAGLAGFALSFALMGLAPDIPLLFVSRVLGGLLSAALIPSALAMVADLTSPAERGRGMGLAGAAMGLGFVFGPAIGGLLARGDDFRLPFFAAAGLAALTLATSAITLRETRPGQAPARPGGFAAGLRRHGATLWAWLVLSFVQTAVFAALEATLALYARDVFGLRAYDVGLLMAFMGLVSALFSGLAAGALIGRAGEVVALKMGFALFGAGFVVALEATALWAFALGMATIGVGMACLRPSLNSGASRRAGDEAGGALGLLHGSDSLARVAGPAMGGALYVAGHSLPLVAGAALSLAALAFTFLALPPAVPAGAPDTSSSRPLSA